MDSSIFISIEPFEIVIDKETNKGETSLRNRTGKDYAFKIKTTHPAVYKVNPCLGVLHKNKEVIIEIKTNTKIDPATIHKHKFLFQFVETGHNLSKEDIKQIFALKTVKKIEKHVSIRYSGLISTESIEGVERTDSHLITFIAVMVIAYCSIILIRKIVFGF